MPIRATYIINPKPEIHKLRDFRAFLRDYLLKANMDDETYLFILDLQKLESGKICLMMGATSLKGVEEWALANMLDFIDCEVVDVNYRKYAELEPNPIPKPEPYKAPAIAYSDNYSEGYDDAVDEFAEDYQDAISYPEDDMWIHYETGDSDDSDDNNDP